MINTIYRFPSGLRMSHRQMTGVHSVAMCVMTGVGSANEDSTNNGISHFVEHMLFKGTSKRDAFQISCDVDGLGAQINAYTSKQVTCYYTVSVDEYVKDCAEILSDIIFHSTFPQDELEREKGVVLEEIAMSEDTPDDLCLENLSSIYFEGSALGQTILGDPKVIKNATREQLEQYIEEHYCADNTVISIAGNIDFESAKAIVERYFEGGFVGSIGAKWQDIPHITKSAKVTKIKDIEQANIAFAFPSLPFDAQGSMALSLMNTVFGGGMSSRLFQDIRERQGLAYSVYSYPNTYKNNGNLSIYLGTNVKTGQKAIKSIATQIELLKDKGLTDEELERGKRQLKGAYALSQESTSSLMRLDAKSVLFENKTFDFDAKIEEIGGITQDDIRMAIDVVFDINKVSASYVGREPNYDALAVLKG